MDVEAASWLAVFEEKVSRLQQNFRDAITHYQGRIEAAEDIEDETYKLLVDTRAELDAYREGWAAYEEFTLDRPGAMDRLDAARARIAALKETT